MRRKSDLPFALPAIIVVAVMTQVPFLLTIIYSTLRWNLARPDLPIKFVGLDNYLYFFNIPRFPAVPEFYSIVWQTILITGLSLVLCTVTGFLVSILLDNKVPGVKFARTLMLGPFFVMSTASGVIWKTTIFNTTFGWYGVIAKAFGMTPVDLVSYHPLFVIIFLFWWEWMPFFVLVILAGLQGIPVELNDSMRIDGTNWLQSTFLVKLPLITNHMQVAIMLGLVFIVKEFGLILVTTAGGPGTRSYTLPYAVYMQVFSASNVGRAGALATITVALVLIIVNVLYRSLKKSGTAAA
jgi:sorbitol/mannitol transport system permease protein